MTTTPFALFPRHERQHRDCQFLLVFEIICVISLVVKAHLVVWNVESIASLIIHILA